MEMAAVRVKYSVMREKKRDIKSFLAGISDRVLAKWRHARYSLSR